MELTASKPVSGTSGVIKVADLGEMIEAPSYTDPLLSPLRLLARER